MASESDLEWLENAIFNHGHPYRTELLNNVKLVEKASGWSAEATYLKTALRHCWEELDWRPSRNGLRVLKKNKMNPY